jgi:hypothetical protein
MRVVHGRRGGLGVHKQAAAARVLTPGAGGRPRREVRTFGAMSDDPGRLAARLAPEGVTRVAMESTGVSRQPIRSLPESRFAPLLVNAQRIKAGPGRKADVKGCEWLADLLRHGLLRAGFVPERARRGLRG